ncbi:unnamed protein product, partial [Allacma fusca]
LMGNLKLGTTRK